MYLIVHVLCITCISQCTSAIAQVVLPAYFIAPVKIHTELAKDFTDKCNCVLMWLSLYYFQHSCKKRERRQVSEKIYF